MKKLICLLIVSTLSLITVFTFIACNKSNEEGGAKSNISQTISSNSIGTTVDSGNAQSVSSSSEIENGNNNQSSNSLGEGSNASSDDENSVEEQITYYTVAFDTDGGTVIANQTVKAGDKAIKPSDPTKPNTANVIFEFNGWYLGETEFDFNTEINADITILAKWNTESYSDDLPIRK